MKTRHAIKPLLFSISLSLSTAFIPAFVFAQSDWQPVSSEQLVKLPINYIAQTIETDFMESTLASDINNNMDLSQLKKQSLRELQTAIETTTNTEQKIELQHQFLMEKSVYLDLMEEHQVLRQQELTTRHTIYERLLSRIQRSNRVINDPQQIILQEQQLEARKRLNASINDINTLLSDSHVGEDSPYSQDYNENLTQLSRLHNAISQHPANTEPMLDGQILTQEQFVRGLLEEIEGDLALLNQENEMMALMARLVALDAQALEHEINLASVDNDSNNNPVTISDAVSIFIN